MTKFAKSLTALALCAIMLSSECTGIFTCAYADEAKESSSVIELGETVQLEDLDTEDLNAAKAVVISDDLETQDKDLLEEVMDNGTGIIVEDMDVEDVQNFFDVDAVAESENLLGCYVSKENDEINVTPIEAEILSEENSDEEVTDADYKELLDAVELDYEKVIEDYEAATDEDKVIQAQAADLATLQTSTKLGTPFAEKYKFIYMYCSPTGQGNHWSTKESDGAWLQSGSITFNIYAIKGRTGVSATYDNIYAVTTATAYNGRAVKEFRNGIMVSNDKSGNTTQNTNQILDYVSPDGQANEQASYTISGSVSIGPDNNVSGSVGGSKTYTYNPNGMSITPTRYSNRVRWTCKPKSLVKNASWTIKPSIYLKKTDGKSTAVTATSYVSYFKLQTVLVGGKGGSTYTLQSDTSCKITFKNHLKV